MDVPGYVELTRISQLLFVLAYQLFLLFAFIIGGPIGRFMTQAFVKFNKHLPPYFDQINSNRNYPYFYMFKNKILSAFKK
jgi:hypothetical protein